MTSFSTRKISPTGLPILFHSAPFPLSLFLVFISTPLFRKRLWIKTPLTNWKRGRRCSQVSIDILNRPVVFPGLFKTFSVIDWTHVDVKQPNPTLIPLDCPRDLFWKSLFVSCQVSRTCDTFMSRRWREEGDYLELPFPFLLHPFPFPFHPSFLLPFPSPFWTPLVLPLSMTTLRQEQCVEVWKRFVKETFFGPSNTVVIRTDP